MFEVYLIWISLKNKVSLNYTTNFKRYSLKWKEYDTGLCLSFVIVWSKIIVALYVVFFWPNIIYAKIGRFTIF